MSALSAKKKDRETSPTEVTPHSCSIFMVCFLLIIYNDLNTRVLERNTSFTFEREKKKEWPALLDHDA